GQSWPPDGRGADPAAGRTLLALITPPAGESVTTSVSRAPAPDAGEPVDAPDDTIDDAAPDAPEARAPDPPAIDAGAATRPARAVASGPPPAPTIKDRWRTVRRLRGYGQFDRAIEECLAIADARDATWSPIALVEAVRIELARRADSESS